MQHQKSMSIVNLDSHKHKACNG